MQGRVALSSAEAELYSSARGTQELLGLAAFIREDRRGKALQLESQLDASATKGIVLRHGVGQLKHPAVRSLWVQKVIQRERVRVLKISRQTNAADALACASNATDLEKHIRAIGGQWWRFLLTGEQGFSRVRSSSEGAATKRE